MDNQSSLLCAMSLYGTEDNLRRKQIRHCQDASHLEIIPFCKLSIFKQTSVLSLDNEAQWFDTYRLAGFFTLRLISTSSMIATSFYTN